MKNIKVLNKSNMNRYQSIKYNINSYISNNTFLTYFTYKLKQDCKITAELFVILVVLTVIIAAGAGLLLSTIALINKGLGWYIIPLYAVIVLVFRVSYLAYESYKRVKENY